MDAIKEVGSSNKYEHFSYIFYYSFFSAIQISPYIVTQNNVIPMMIISGNTTLLHIFICWVLVFKSGLGNKGAAMANAISYWVNAISLMLYVKKSPTCKETWAGFSKEALHGIPKFLMLAIPSALSLIHI